MIILFLVFLNWQDLIIPNLYLAKQNLKLEGLILAKFKIILNRGGAIKKPLK